MESTADRFRKTANFEYPEIIVTYDLIDNNQLLEMYGGKSNDLVVRNAEMCQRIGLDSTRYIHDPLRPWIYSKIDIWERFFGIKREDWIIKEGGKTAWIAKRPFKDLRGLEKHMPKVPSKDEVAEWWIPYTRHITEVFQEYDLVFVTAVEGPLCEAYMYAGMDLFFKAIYKAPELAMELLDVFTRWGEIIAELHAKHPTSPVFFQNDDICGTNGPFISPSFLEEEMVKRWNRVYTPAREAGLKCIFHTDGNAHPIMDMLVKQVRIDGFNPIDQAGMDIRKLRREYPKLLLFGNVDCAFTLPKGKVQDVEEETKALLRDIAPSGGLFLGSSSEIDQDVPPENALAMYRTAKKYGRYPINLDALR